MDIKMVEEVEKMKKEDGIFLHGKNYNIDTVLGDTEESREIIRCTWPSINMRISLEGRNSVARSILSNIFERLDGNEAR